MHSFVNYLYYIRRAYKHSPVVSGELLSEPPAVIILGNSGFFQRSKRGRFLSSSPGPFWFMSSPTDFFSFSLILLCFSSKYVTSELSKNYFEYLNICCIFFCMCNMSSLRMGMYVCFPMFTFMSGIFIRQTG